MTGALFRKLKREVHAAHDALLRAPSGWVAQDLASMWFMPQQAADVTRHAALAEECGQQPCTNRGCRAGPGESMKNSISKVLSLDIGI